MSKTTEICQKQQNSASSLRYHIESVHKDSKHKCDLCNMKFSHQTTLKTHIKHVHELAMDFHCGVCDFKTKTKDSLRRHFTAMHSKEEDQTCVQCNICNVTVKSQKHLKSHIKKMHEERKDKFTCNDCGKQLLSKLSFKLHREAIHEQKKYACDICDRKFTQKTPLNTHMKRIHFQEANYNCSKCERPPFVTSEALKRHEKIHERNGEKTHKCDQCDFKGYDKIQVQKHKVSVHSTTMRFTCQICDKTFKQRRSLTHHSRKHHSNEDVNTFHCSLCDYKSDFKPVGLKYENKRKYENTKTLVKSEFLATSTRFRNSAQLTA